MACPPRESFAAALQVLGGILVLLVSVALGNPTFQRNRDYRSELLDLGRHRGQSAGQRPSPLQSRHVLGERGRIDEAIAEYRKAAGNRSRLAEAHNNLGAGVGRRGQFDEAIGHYQKALEIKPDYAEAHYNLGNALADRGRIDEAIEHYRKALEIKPDYAEAHNNLGKALADRGQIDEAIVHFQKALEIRPDHAEAHNNLGMRLGQRGQIDEAIVHYQKALEIKPDYADAHNNLGIALAGCGRFDEAIVHFQEALKTQAGRRGSPRQPRAWRSRRREEIVKALAQRRESLRRHPDDVALLNETAWVLATNPNASIRNGAEAVELAQRAARTLRPDANRPFSAPWPPPMPRRADSPRRFKRPRRPWSWPPAKTVRPWPMPFAHASSSIRAICPIANSNKCLRLRPVTLSRAAAGTPAIEGDSPIFADQRRPTLRVGARENWDSPPRSPCSVSSRSQARWPNCMSTGDRVN